MDESLCVLSESPAITSRIPIFAPTRRPKVVNKWRVETPWGHAVITGKLGQQHRDLIDAVMTKGVKVDEQWTIDGRLNVKIDPNKLRSAMGGAGTNNANIEAWIDDLRVARVDVYDNDKCEKITGGIVSDYSVSTDPTLLRPRPGARGEGRRYMRLTFSPGWSKLIETERMMRYPLAQVVKLKSGFAQAVARFCLSHRHVDDTILGLTNKVAAGGLLRHRRADLESDKDALNDLGITVDGNRIKSGKRRQSPVERRQSPVSVGKVQ